MGILKNVMRCMIVLLLTMSIPVNGKTQENGQYFEKGVLQLTATDNDGWATVKTYVARWNDERRKWDDVISKEYTRDGKADYSLSPGVYQLRMYYTEAIPNTKRVIENIQISDKGVVSKNEYFEKGALRLTTTDNDGWATAKTYVARWNDEKRKWDDVISKEYTRDGKADYSLSPGVYQLRMYYTEAIPNTKRVIENIQISDKGIVSKNEYFEKGALRLTTTDNDGWATAKTYVARWNDEKRKWDDVISKEYTRDGMADYSLSPGVYQLRMYYTEAIPNTKRVIENIQISDKGIVSKNEYFEKGVLRLTATDNDGWAAVKTYVARWNDEKRRWDDVISKEYTRDGKADYTLSPGVYQLRMYYTEADPNTKRVIEGIQVFDRQASSIGENFGNGNLPPLISAGGPFEIGDGDGYYEVGEKALFRIDIRDSDLSSIELLVNDRLIRTLKNSGRFEQVLSLSGPGDYKFSVRARDKNGTLETYGRTIPVNMQKARTSQSIKYLSSEYGQAKTGRKCPQCGREYQDDSTFCSDDGTKLNPVENVIHKALNTSLINAGLDPKTTEAQHAKQLGLDWLNPFASQEQIDEDIQQLVDDVIQN